MPGSQLSVLILDDDLLALELYVRELKGNYQVITGRTAAEARSMLKKESFDVLIIEPAVNDGEGWNLLKEVQALRKPPRVILCSVEDERKSGLEQGAYAFFVKPVIMPVLHHVLDQMTSQTPSHRLPNQMNKAEKGK